MPIFTGQLSLLKLVKNTYNKCFLIPNFFPLLPLTTSISRLIVGGLDGTVSFFVVAHNSPHELEDTRIALKKLPSRKWQKRHRQTEEEEDKTQSMSTQSAEAELERRKMRKKEVLRRFRYI